MLTRRLVVIAALAIAVSGCKLGSQSAPGLSGPSALGLSVELAASADILSQDGQAHADITATVKDASGAPKRGLSFNVTIWTGSFQSETGTLSSRVVSTDNNGVAKVTYTAPPEPAAGATNDTQVTIGFTPIQSDYKAELMRTVDILLVRPGVIVAPTGDLVALFDVSTSQPNIGEAVGFDATKSIVGPGRSIVSYKWNFGDGATATGKVVSHAYKSSGGFVATLTVTDDLGRTASTSAPVSISTTAPTAIFNVSPNDVFIGDNVQFNAKASFAAPGRTIVDYQWDFGDGSGASGQVVSHAYSAQKSYVVTLTVVDDLGQTGTTTQDVDVDTAAPKADFNISPPTATQSVTVVSFSSALSTAPPGRTLTAFQWDFGDGSSSTAANPTHVYTLTGTFTVVLVVTDNTGAIGVTSKTISVTAPGP